MCVAEVEKFISLYVLYVKTKFPTKISAGIETVFDIRRRSVNFSRALSS